jgi:DNA-binding transcriptional regulator GbsR (MarR family)
MTAEYETAQQRLIEAWGEMASRWGVSKTMAQVYALLFSSREAMDTETIMQRLSISRGNANMNLHKLMDWQIVRKVDLPERRRDYFVAEKDVWRLTEHIIRERQKLEINPVSIALDDINNILAKDTMSGEDEQEFSRRVQEMNEFIHLFDALTNQVLPLVHRKDSQQLMQLMANITA